jgi:protein SCO1/2
VLVFFGFIWYLINPFQKELSLSKISATTLKGEMPLSECFHEKTIVYFGYVSCPTICPMTMNRLAEALKYDEQNNTKVIFISLSSQDDFSTSHTYAQLYHEKSVALDVSEEDLEKLTAWLNVQYRNLENGEINHSGNLYLFKEKELVKVLPFGVEVERIIKALKRIEL